MEFLSLSGTVICFKLQSCSFRLCSRRKIFCSGDMATRRCCHGMGSRYEDDRICLLFAHLQCSGQRAVVLKMSICGYLSKLRALVLKEGIIILHLCPVCHNRPLPSVRFLLAVLSDQLGGRKSCMEQDISFWDSFADNRHITEKEHFTY